MSTGEEETTEPESPAPSKATVKKKTAPKKVAPKAAKVKAAPPAPPKAVPKVAKKVAAPKPVSAKASSRTKYLANQFKMVGDPTRLSILQMLNGTSLCVTDICTTLTQTQPGVSHHLALLRHGRFIESTRDGKNNFYSLTETGQALADVVENFPEA